MSKSTNSFQDQLQLLREEYASALQQKVAAIITAWESLIDHTWNEADAQVLHRMVHTLIGSSATFGFVPVQYAARSLERVLKYLRESNTPPTPSQCQQVEIFLNDLHRAAMDASISNVDEQVNLAISPTSVTPLAQGNNRLIYLVEPDPLLVQDLVLQIMQFGYTTRVFQHLEEVISLAPIPPAAVVIDTPFPDNRLVEMIKQRMPWQEHEITVPVMFISAQGDLEARLQAVRADGAAYFTKPLDVSRFVDRLDTLTNRYVPEPYRILIVDDDADTAEYYAVTLQQEHMIIEIVTNPLAVMHALMDFKADLILMDLYMPDCNGLELAKVIRQQEAFVSIPIVFLSAETNLDKQMAALRLGGDDFLTKPIQPDHLIASVIARVQRSRTLHSFMVRDSLTGLLNHTKLKECLGVEVARSLRYCHEMSFVMIDIDHFKAVNDTYGHSSGDKVIKSLARLLQQRLRKTDTIGRYGGEEFGVILPETQGHNARQVVNEIRKSFSQVMHEPGNDNFSVTFSAGIATCPPYYEAAMLSDAADRALYAAKHAGRNRVFLSEESYLE